MTMLFLAIGMMHPCASTFRERIRLSVIGINIALVIIPCFIIITNDMHIRILTNDMPNLVRQLIIIVCITFVFIKMISSIVRRKELKEIIDTISADYDNFNNMPEDYQKIVHESITKTKFFERIWMAAIAITASSYPVLATVFTVHSQLLTDTPKSYMVHDCYVIFLSDEQRFQTPYFEMFNVFAMTTVWLIFIGFTGFDGMFTISIIHVSLKLRFISQNLIHLLDSGYDGQLYTQTYGSRADIVLLPGQEKDLNTYIYYCFAIATAVHIYLPCYLAADVANYGVEICDFAYGCKWETIPDLRIRRSIAMIINRAQVPIRFRALGMLTYNMELYLKILQTSYSMFTILRK
ncbi:uncharacterized protein LOC121731235 [Aricia agestis]|uniref:uncharacterized protein LOC121731235 n=1 Tax=Aricia agestis TaxID=91739 RepID=UPI001C20471D|nr:uncharacterized protein LOC121731235 [Aricia agestis]